MPVTAPRLDVYLVNAGLAPTRSKAREAILRGDVTVDGAPARRAGQPVPQGARVEAETDRFASRGARKLMAALDAFAIAPAGRHALDVGASTGGFTDVLLHRGAARVAALDVGHGQLAPALAADPRVTVMDGVNARHLRPGQLPFRPDLLVADVSFISLTLALPPALDAAAPSATVVALVKPQFEVGRAHVGKGGIVRDETAARAAIARVAERIAAHGFAMREAIPSPITGGDGNREWLIAGMRS